MANRVERKDLFGDKLIPAEEIKQGIKLLDLFDASLVSIAKNSTKVKEGFDFKSISGLKKANDEFDKIEVAFKETNKLAKEKIRLNERLKQSTSEQAKSNAVLSERLREQKKANKELAREQLGLISEYQKLSKRLISLRNEYKNLAAQNKENTKEGRALLKQVKALDSRLKGIDKTVGQSQRNVGNYSGALKGLRSEFRSLGLRVVGAATLIRGFGRALKSGFSIIKNFDKANAELAGVLDKNRGQIQALTDDAKRLGSTTAVTATDVTKLQIAYSRLGFTQAQILNLTEPTISGSIALNASLEDTATLVGAMVNSFDDFSAQDAPKILDSLSASTQKTALDFEKLQAALPIVSGAANTAGISFNRLLALLGKLSDSGIDASSSATALRNIFIESAKQGKSYDEILEEIVNSQDKLTAANDEFGKRAAVSATVLSKNLSATKDLEEALDNAGGTAERVAETQLDTLDGKLKLLDSAWEGFVLSLENGEGVFAQILGGAIEFATEFLNLLSGGRKTVQDVISDQIEFNAQFNRSIDILKNSNIPFAQRKEIMNDINKEYGEYLPSLLDEKTTLEDLTAIQKQFNLESKERLRLAVRQTAINNLQEDQQNRIKTITALQTGNLSKLSLSQRVLFNTITEGQKQEILKRLQDGYIESEEALAKLLETSGEAPNLIDAATASFKNLGEAAKQSGEETEGANKKTLRGLEKLRNQLSELKKDRDQAVSSEKDLNSARVKTLSNEIFLTSQKIKLLEEELNIRDEIAALELEEVEILSPELIDTERAEEQGSTLISALLRVSDEQEKAHQKERERIKKEQEEWLKNLAEREDAFKELARGILSQLETIQEASIDLKIGEIDEESERRQQRLATFQEQAAKGQLDAKESLAEEEKKISDLEDKRATQEKRKLIFEASIAALTSLVERLKLGQPQPVAAAGASSDVLQVITAVSALPLPGTPAFYEGTENTGPQGRGIDGKGGFNAILHPYERVVPAKDNSLIPDSMDNETLARVANLYNKGLLLPMNAFPGLRAASGGQAIIPDSSMQQLATLITGNFDSKTPVSPKTFRKVMFGTTDAMVEALRKNTEAIKAKKTNW